MISLPRNLFPTRRVKALKSLFTGGLTNLLTGVGLLGLATFIFAWQGPGIWRDIVISQNPVVIYDSAVHNGECRERRFITTCEADVSYHYAGKFIETEISFAFIDFSSGNYSVEVVISGDHPRMATLDLGLDMLWNRIAVTGSLGGLLLFGGLYGIGSFFDSAAANRRAKEGGTLSPVALEITQVKKVMGGKVVTYRQASGKKGMRKVHSLRFGKEEAPIFVCGPDDKAYAVGAAMAGLKAPIILDDRLERLDFTAEERARIQAALSAEDEHSAG